MTRPVAALTLAAALLAACAPTDEVSRRLPPNYLANAAERVAAADWSDPETVTLTLGASGFVPAELTLRRDRPTRLVVVNASGADHELVAPEFFRDVAVERLSGPDGVTRAAWVSRVGLPAGQTREIWLIAARFGAYRFECGRLGHAALGERGLISVEP
jgi:uncharacterized cupredoxin-like copper-binding protein